MTATYDFSMVRGDTKRLEVTVRDEAGAIVDLTGSSIRWRIARSVSSVALISKAIGTGITVVNATLGRFDILLTAAESATLPVAALYHESEVIDSGGQVSTILRGTVTVDKDLIV